MAETPIKEALHAKLADVAKLAINLVPGARVEYRGTFYDHGDFKALAYRAGALTANGSQQLIKMDTKIYDPAGRFDLANGWYVAPVQGVYLCSYGANNTPAGLMDSGISVSADGSLSVSRFGESGTSATLISSSVPVLANQNDKIQLVVKATNAQNYTPGIDRLYLGVFLIGAQ